MEKIGGVLVHNRKELCCRARADGAVVKIFDENRRRVFTSMPLAGSPSNLYAPISSFDEVGMKYSAYIEAPPNSRKSIIGRRIVIRQGAEKRISIAEVRVGDKEGRNVARGKKITSFSQFNANTGRKPCGLECILDGDNRTFTTSSDTLIQPNIGIEIDLGAMIDIQNIYITAHDGGCCEGSLEGAQVFIFNNTGDMVFASRPLVVGVRQDVGPQILLSTLRTTDFQMVHALELYQDSVKHVPLNIAEINVYDHVGLRVDTSQARLTASSLYSGTHGLVNLNDANVKTFARTQEAMHGSNNWFKMELQDDVMVSRIVVKNRMDAEQAAADGLKVVLKSRVGVELFATSPLRLNAQRQLPDIFTTKGAHDLFKFGVYGKLFSGDPAKKKAVEGEEVRVCASYTNNADARALNLAPTAAVTYSGTNTIDGSILQDGRDGGTSVEIELRQTLKFKLDRWSAIESVTVCGGDKTIDVRVVDFEGISLSQDGMICAHQSSAHSCHIFKCSAPASHQHHGEYTYHGEFVKLSFASTAKVTEVKIMGKRQECDISTFTDMNGEFLLELDRARFNNKDLPTMFATRETKQGNGMKVDIYHFDEGSIDVSFAEWTSVIFRKDKCKRTRRGDISEFVRCIYAKNALLDTYPIKAKDVKIPEEYVDKAKFGAFVIGRYVKIQKNYFPDPGHLNIAEVEVVGTDGTTNIARGKPVCVPEGLCTGRQVTPIDVQNRNGNYHTRFPASNLVDGSPLIFAHSWLVHDPMYVIDLGAELEISAIRVFARRGDEATSSGAFVSVLNDAKEEVYTYPLANPSSGSQAFPAIVVPRHALPVPAQPRKVPKKARYVDIVAGPCTVTTNHDYWDYRRQSVVRRRTTTNSKREFRLAEVEIFGTDGTKNVARGANVSPSGKTSTMLTDGYRRRFDRRGQSSCAKTSIAVEAKYRIELQKLQDVTEIQIYGCDDWG